MIDQPKGWRTRASIESTRLHMLFWSAVLNGALSAPLIVLVTLLTSDKTIMGEHVSSPLLRWLGWATAFAMGAATIAMLVAL